MFPQDTGRREGEGARGFGRVRRAAFLSRLGRRLRRRLSGRAPVCSCSAERWKRVYGTFLEGQALPPVELYKPGGAYFVVDGNHRVSVARSLQRGGGRGCPRHRVRVSGRRGTPFTATFGKGLSAKFALTEFQEIRARWTARAARSRCVFRIGACR